MTLPDADLAPFLAFMDRQEIDAAVVSSFLPVTDAAAARAVNEEYADCVSVYRRRLGALAVLPLADIDSAQAELAYALDTLELDGVILPTNVAGTYLGDPRLEPLLSELDRRSAYVLVHPAFPPYTFPLPQYTPSYFEMSHETTRAVANLAFTGTLGRLSRIKLQLVHLGGTLPSLARRMARLAEISPEREAMPEGFLACLRHFYFDTAAASDVQALNALLEITTLDRVVLGSDWPLFRPLDGSDAPLGVPELALDRQAQIAGPNAAQLVPRLARAVARG